VPVFSVGTRANAVGGAGKGGLGAWFLAMRTYAADRVRKKNLSLFFSTSGNAARRDLTVRVPRDDGRCVPPNLLRFGCQRAGRHADIAANPL
jgi:hypothetical protein